MNSIHTFAFGKSYEVIANSRTTDQELRYINSETFSVQFTCNETDNTTYPHILDTKCINYEWCLNNYRQDFYGNTC